uniref:Uncharacterized protein n=1 Tax=Timema monikensis TaxID=170555 RepID=A0A7R9EAS7_9NEOP|nr:unnamed protein product [Timema monikensis]
MWPYKRVVRSIDRRYRLKFKKWRRRAMEKEGGDGGGEKGGGQQDAASLLDAASLFVRCGTLVYRGDELGVSLGAAESNNSREKIEHYIICRYRTETHCDHLHLNECVVASIRLSGYPATPQHDAVASISRRTRDTQRNIETSQLLLKYRIEVGSQTPRVSETVEVRI